MRQLFPVIPVGVSPTPVTTSGPRQPGLDLQRKKAVPSQKQHRDVFTHDYRFYALFQKNN